MLIKDILERQKHNKKIAIKYGDMTATYIQLYTLVQEHTNYIKQYGCSDGNVGIFLPNSIQYCVAYFTIAFSDRVIVPISTLAKSAEIRSTIEYCDLGMIITNSHYKAALKGFLEEPEYRVVIYNIEDKSFESIGPDIKVFEDIGRDKSFDENSTALLLHTSGTTSCPKRVMLTHKSLIANIESIINSFRLTQDDVTLISTPMIFAGANTYQFLTHIYLGATIIIMQDIFITGSFFRLVQQEKVTYIFAVPPMLLAMLEYKERFNYDVSSLRYITFGGGYMPVDKLQQLIEGFPSIGFVQVYGQTEASPRISHLMPEDSLRKIGSVGKSIPGVKVRIVDERGNDVKAGDTGEIIIQGENVMKGYYKRGEETGRTLRNRWLFSGDLARYDEEGYIYLVGRKKNMIISGGINIYPEEIEETLLNHTAVKEACVVREEHPVYGEVPVAKVVLKSEIYDVTEGDIKNYCLRSLANYKVPFRIDFVKEISRTASGKIKRY